MAKQAMEQEEREKQERLKEMERKREKITLAEWELAAQKQALLKAEKGMEERDNNDDVNATSQSPMSEQMVSVLLPLHTALTRDSIR